MIWAVLFVVVAIVAVLVWINRPSPPATTRRFEAIGRDNHSRAGLIALAGRKWCEFPVAGTTYHQRELEIVLANADGDGHVPVVLVQQRDNPKDENAVAVTVGHMLVGFIPRDDAAHYRAQADLIGLGRSDASCWGYVFRADDDRHEHPIRMRLGLQWPIAVATEAKSDV